MIPAKHRPLAAAVREIHEAINDTLGSMMVAMAKARRVGFLLLEVKPLVGHGNFEKFITENFPQISFDTAQRWMRAMENVIGATKVQPHLLSAPLSHIIDADQDTLTTEDREAQQLLLDFTKDKTIADCLRCVVVEGDEPHRITRAHNGRTQGGHNGKDRKDWPGFIRRKLSDIGSHLKYWQSMTGAQTEAVQSHFKAELSKWPTPLLEHLKKTITEEIKNR